MNLTRGQFEEIKSLPLFKGKVITDSMVPVIQVGEDIIVDVGEKSLKRFDIVVIYADGKLICHYLWNINSIISPFVIQTRNMKGGYDFPVKEEDYLGKVVSHRIPFWRKVKITF